MERPTAPCLDCPNREVGCHGKCEVYKEFRIALQAEKQAKKKKCNYSTKARIDGLRKADKIRKKKASGVLK